MRKLQDITIGLLLVGAAGGAAHGAALFMSSLSGAAVWLLVSIITIAAVTYWALHMDESKTKAIIYFALALLPLGLLLLVGNVSFHHMILGWDVAVSLENQVEYLVFTLVLSATSACHAAIAWP